MYDTITTKAPKMIEEAYEYVEDVTTTVTERVKTEVKTSGMTGAWAVTGLRREVEKVEKTPNTAISSYFQECHSLKSGDSAY